MDPNTSISSVDGQIADILNLDEQDNEQVHEEVENTEEVSHGAEGWAAVCCQSRR